MKCTEQDLFIAGFSKISKFYWESDSLDGLISKSIPLSKGSKGYVVPICRFHQGNLDFSEDLILSLPQSRTLVGGVFTKSDLKDLLTYKENEFGFVVVNQYFKTVGILSFALLGAVPATLLFKKSILFDQNHFDLFQSATIIAIKHLDDSLVVDTFHALATDQQDEMSYVESLGFRQRTGIYVKHTYDVLLPPKTDILTAGPMISARETSYVLDAVRFGWNNEWAKYIKLFEEKFSRFLNIKYAITTSSCTGALHIALKALGIGPGDEVIVPEITWVATASAVTYVGATPIFAEIDESNWCIDPTKIQSLITAKTKCIIPVHVYGHPADMDAVMEVANRNKIFVIEDAAPAIGAECRGKRVGSFGHFACFSFQGAKLLVTGEGGMLVTNDPELYKRAYAIWDHGRTPGTFWINEIGLKYKMANILAALGLGQIEGVEEQIRAKRRIFNWYRDELKDFPHVKVWTESAWAKSIYWMSSIILEKSAKITREELFVKLKAYKIDTRSTFPAISTYPMWQNTNNLIAKKVGETGINLPSGVCLKEKEVRYVAKMIKEIILKARGEIAD